MLIGIAKPGLDLPSIKQGVAPVGEELVCDSEPSNDRGRYAVAVIMLTSFRLEGSLHLRAY